MRKKFTMNTTIALDILALHNRLHSLLTWARTIDVSFGMSKIELVVYWRSNNTAHSSRQPVALGSDFETLFDYACNLLRQAYLQTC